MSQPTCSPAQIVADTIVRTVELGVTITDAAIDGETTVVSADLLAGSPGRCSGCGAVGDLPRPHRAAAHRASARGAPDAAAGAGPAVSLP